MNWDRRCKNIMRRQTFWIVILSWFSCWRESVRNAFRCVYSVSFYEHRICASANSWRCVHSTDLWMCLCFSFENFFAVVKLLKMQSYTILCLDKARAKESERPKRNLKQLTGFRKWTIVKQKQTHRHTRSCVCVVCKWVHSQCLGMECFPVHILYTWERSVLKFHKISYDKGF